MPEHFRSFLGTLASHVFGLADSFPAAAAFDYPLVIAFPAGGYPVRQALLCRFFGVALAMDMETTHDSIDKNKSLG